MTLDPQTIIMMNIIGTLLMSISLFVVSRGYLAQIKGVTKWATATMIQSFGWLFVGALRGIVPEVISVVLGNGLLLLCLGLYLNIFEEFSNKKIHNFWVFLIIALEAIALSYFVLISPNVAARIIVNSVGPALLMFACGYVLFSNKSNRPASHLLMASFSTFCGFFMILRAFYTLLVNSDPNQLPFDARPIHSLTFLTFFITSVILSFCFILMCNDRYISERKQAEELILKNEKQLNDAQQLAKIGSWEFNVLTSELTWSKEHYRIFELEETPPDKLYRVYRSKIHPDDIPRLDTFMADVIEHGKGFNYEHRVICNNNNIKYVRGIGQTIKDEHGKTISLIGTVQDITQQKKDEENIRQSELRYRTLAEASEDIVFIINAKGTVDYVNDFAARRFRQPASALIGKQMKDLFPSEAAEHQWDNLKKVMISGESVYIEKPTDLGGQIIWLGTNLVALRDTNNKITSVMGVSRDITQQKKDEEILRQSELRYRTLAEASEDMVFIISPKGTIEYLNDYAARQFDQPASALIGKQMADFFPSTEEERRWELFQKVFKSGQSDYSENLTNLGGQLRWLGSNLVALRDADGNITSVMGVGRDITEKKRSEQELIIAKELAEKLAGAKDRFLSNMSHEIRTPINGIIGFTRLLLQHDFPEKQKQQLNAIRTSSDILLVLVNDILDLAKINEGKMSLEETDFKLSELVDNILATFELRFDEKKLKVLSHYDKNIPQLIIGDSVRISQILLNLINNSIKFTHAKGQITISVNLLHDDEEKATIEIIIADTGIGIAEEKLDTIFEPFTQNNDGIVHLYEGTGLGLSIVKRLTNLMKGSISVKSVLNEGTTIIVIIPLKKTNATEIAAKKETLLLADDLNQIGPLKILLAEDNEINQLLAQTILHQFGFEVDTAENGNIAIEFLTINQYDIILMDLKMPEMGGFEATQYIRTRMQLPKSMIPIIAITADVTKVDIEKYNEAGMNDYITKPFNQTELLNKIINLVKKTEKNPAINNV